MPKDRRQAMLEMVAKKLNVPIQQIEQAMQSGDLSQIPAFRQNPQMQALFQDKAKIQQMIQSKETQEWMKKFSGGK